MSTNNGVNWRYFDKFDKINDLYLPDRGEGETKATQLVTAINKLVYKWYNDGDVYDNTGYMEGWGNDISDVANWIYRNYPESRTILDEIYYARTDGDYENILKNLADKFLDSKFLSNENNKTASGSIYNTDGKFTFEEYVEEEEDYYEEDEDDEY